MAKEDKATANARWEKMELSKEEEREYFHAVNRIKALEASSAE